MKVREAVLSDVDDVAVLFDQYRGFYKKGSDLALAKYFIEERIGKKESIIFVAENDNGEIVGFAQLYPTFSSVSAKRAYIFNDLFVDQDYRKKGAATALINASTNFCRNQAAAYLMLETGQDNLAAQALYEKHGFEQENDFLVYAISF